MKRKVELFKLHIFTTKETKYKSFLLVSLVKTTYSLTVAEFFQIIGKNYKKRKLLKSSKIASPGCIRNITSTLPNAPA